MRLPARTAVLTFLLGGCQLIGSYERFGGAPAAPGGGESTAAGRRGSGGSGGESRTTAPSTGSDGGAGAGGAPLDGGGGVRESACEAVAWELSEPDEIRAERPYRLRVAGGPGTAMATWSTDDGRYTATFWEDGTLLSGPIASELDVQELVALDDLGFAGVSQNEGGAWISLFDRWGALLDRVHVERDPVPWESPVDPIATEHRRLLGVRWTGTTLLLLDVETLSVAALDVEVRVTSTWQRLADPWLGGSSRNVHLIGDLPGHSLLVYRENGDGGPGPGLLAQTIDQAGNFGGAAVPTDWLEPTASIHWSCAETCWVVVDGARWVEFRADDGLVTASERPSPLESAAMQAVGGLAGSGCRVVFTACTDPDAAVEPHERACWLVRVARDGGWSDVLETWGPPAPDELPIVPQVVAVTPSQLLVFESGDHLSVRRLRWKEPS